MRWVDKFFRMAVHPNWGDIRLTFFLLAICALMWWAGSQGWIP